MTFTVRSFFRTKRPPRWRRGKVSARATPTGTRGRDGPAGPAGARHGRVVPARGTFPNRPCCHAVRPSAAIQSRCSTTPAGYLQLQLARSARRRTWRVPRPPSPRASPSSTRRRSPPMRSLARSAIPSQAGRRQGWRIAALLGPWLVPLTYHSTRFPKKESRMYGVLNEVYL